MPLSSFVQNLETDGDGSKELASILNIVSKEAFEKSHTDTHTEPKFEKTEKNTIVLFSSYIYLDD